MSIQWHARTKAGGELERNPIGGAYFADEAIDLPAQALVRELLQNARDARIGTQPVKVRLAVYENNEAAGATIARKWFESLWPHLKSSDSGIRDVSDHPGSKRFLVVEDFETHGLTGRVDLADAPSDASAQRERFFAFARAEGYTNKEAGGGGSWGVGKTVFARSSEINTTFAMSVREDLPQRILIGQSILKFRSVDRFRYAPEVMWGSRTAAGQIVLPVDDAAKCAEFRRDFRVTRDRQPGLSIVVPDLHEDITALALARHTMLEYFLPILRGQLIVEIVGNDIPGGQIVLEDRSLVTGLSLLGSDDSSRVIPLIGLAKWTCSQPLLYQSVPPSAGIPAWNQIIPDADAKSLAVRFQDGERLGIRVRANIRKAGQSLPGHFDLFVHRSESEHPTRPAFVRDGIVIPKVRERGLRGVRVHAIVVCEGNPLAELLRDAEGPGHTHWSIETQSARNRFKSEYLNGKSLIDLVEGAPRAFVERMLSTLTDRDTSTFAEDFPVPVDENTRRARTRKKKRIPGPEQLPKDLPKKRRAFTIEPRKGGFIIRATNDGVSRPAFLHIRVAYDRTRGNPFSHYHPADFKLNQHPICVESSGVREVTRHENVLRVELVADDFSVDVSGFDVYRDVEVDVRPVGADGDAAQLDDDEEVPTADDRVLIAGGAS